MLHKMPKQPFNSSFLKYAGMASQMAIIILVFVGIGRYLDGKMENPIPSSGPYWALASPFTP